MAKQIGNTDLIDTWASEGNIVDPDPSKKEEGWLLGEQPPHEWMNHIQNEHGQKINRLLDDTYSEETGLNRRVIYVDTVADLQALDTSGLVGGKAASVQGSEFRWSGSEWRPVGAVSVKAFGAKGDGVTDDTDALQSAFDYGPVIIPDGTYKHGPMQVSSSFLMTPGASFIYDGPSDQTCLYFSGDSLYFNRISIDAGGAESIAVLFDCTSSRVEYIKINNMESSSVGASIGLVINSTTNTFGAVAIEDFVNTGNPNGSMPQGISVANETAIENIYLNRTRSGLVLASGSNHTRVGGMFCLDVGDNGVYQLGGRLTLGSLFFEDGSEAIVFKGDAYVDSISVRGQGFISFDDCGEVSIGNIDLSKGRNGNTPAAIFRLRGTNTFCKSININSVTGTINRGVLLQAGGAQSSGEIGFLKVCNVSIDYEYDPELSGTISQFVNFEACLGFYFKDWAVRVVDIGGSLVSEDFFGRMPDVSKSSLLENFDVYILDSDEKDSTSGARFRMNPPPNNENIRIIGARFQASTQFESRIREVSFGPRDCITQVPTIGFWRRGQDFLLVNATSPPLRARCIESGVPGTWVSY